MENAMKLNKRYLRNIKSNLSFYIASTVLTMVTLLLFYLFYIAGTGIDEYGEKFFEEHNREDASLTTYVDIPKEDISKLEKTYGLIMEKEQYANVDEKDYTARIFSRNKKIDLCEITAGHDITSNDEILISEGYAANMNVQLGDTLVIGDREYTVCGYFLRPDYLYMLENTSDSYKNITSFFLAYLSEEEFSRFQEPACSYKVIYETDSDEMGFRKYVNETYITRTYVSADENARITFVHEQADTFILMAWVMLVLLPFITVSLISIIIGRKVKNEQKMIGTLSALGYKKSTLMWHYTWLAVIPGLFGGILTAVAAVILAQPYGSLGLADYEPMKANFSLPVGIAVLGVLIPSVIYMLAALLKVRKLLKNDTVILLNGSAGEKRKTNRVLYHMDGKIQVKFALRSLVGNPGRTFVVFLGIFLGAMIVSVGYEFIDSIKEIGRSASSELGDFSYEYILNQIGTGTPEEGEPMIMAAFETDQSSFSVLGADENGTLFNLNTEDGRADLSKGWYISSLCAYLYDLDVGDTLSFRSITNLEEYSVTISGIIQNNYQKYIISDRRTAAELLGWEHGDCYNVLLTDKKADLDDNIISNTISGTTMKDQMNTILDEMNALIYALIIIGAIICIAALYVSINMMVTENRNTISMLKVLGYQDKRIDRMVLHVNHILLPFGIAAGILVSYLSMEWYFLTFADTEGMLIPATIRPLSIVLTVIIVCLCYFCSLFLVRRKVSKVDMVESLKDNRE